MLLRTLQSFQKFHRSYYGPDLPQPLTFMRCCRGWKVCTWSAIQHISFDSLSVSLSLSLSVCHFLSLSLHIYICLSTSLFLFPSFSLSLSISSFLPLSLTFYFYSTFISSCKYRRWSIVEIYSEIQPNNYYRFSSVSYSILFFSILCYIALYLTFCSTILFCSILNYTILFYTISLYFADLCFQHSMVFIVSLLFQSSHHSHHRLNWLNLLSNLLLQIIISFHQVSNSYFWSLDHISISS